MVTILPHTTRATGTVLTATIYNADHQNHITNVTTINADAAYVDVGNSFSADQTIDKSAATLTLKGTGNSQIEIGRVDGVSSTPFINFHSGTTAVGHDSRIIASGGNGSNAGGVLTVVATSVQFSGGVLAKDATDGSLIIYGGTSGDGANVELYGSTHATTPNQAFIDANTTAFRNANGAGTPTVTIGGNTVWHAGNDGAGSGLDADLLDGNSSAFYLAASSYTAADVLSKLLTVDGAGSGLDADLLDGLNQTAAATASTIVARDSGGDTAVDVLTATAVNFTTSLLFTISGSEQWRFNADGTLLSNGLTVTKTAVGDSGTGFSFATSGLIWASRSGAVQAILNRDANDGVCMHFGREKVLVGSISVTAAATAYNTSSDARLKRDLKAIDPSIIDRIKVYDFAWKHDGSRSYGCTAQELHALLPHTVFKGDNPETDMWAVDYSKLVPLLIAKCQDLEKRLAALEAA